MRVRMNGGRKRQRAGLVVLLAPVLLCMVGGLGALPARGQAATREKSLSRVVSEIDDLHSGNRWILSKAPDHPGGPGRMTRVSNLRAFGAEGVKGDGRIPDASSPATPLPWVIRSGDRLIVEEHSAVVEGRLDAIALGSAACGGSFKARLEIGGRVVEVVALGAGRAALVLETRARP